MASSELELHRNAIATPFPEIAPTLPLPIPTFKYVVQEASAHYPLPFVGYKVLAGGPPTNYMPEIWDETWWWPAVARDIIDGYTVL